MAHILVGKLFVQQSGRIRQEISMAVIGSSLRHDEGDGYCYPGSQHWSCALSNPSLQDDLRSVQAL
eukprot:2345866-Amphidinium_carterae.1